MGKLIHMTKVEEGFDYSCGTFTSTFEREGNTYYATFHAEAVVTPGEPNLQFTNNVLVVMMHPEHGTINFLFLSSEEGWQVDFSFADFAIEKELVDWCIEQIEKHAETKPNPENLNADNL